MCKMFHFMLMLFCSAQQLRRSLALIIYGSNTWLSYHALLLLCRYHYRHHLPVTWVLKGVLVWALKKYFSCNVILCVKLNSILCSKSMNYHLDKQDIITLITIHGRFFKLFKGIPVLGHFNYAYFAQT